MKVRHMLPRDGIRAVAIAVGLWVIWTVATWWFEGRINTLGRPDAVADRLVYSITVNLGIGILGAAFTLRYLLRAGLLARPTGFGAPSRTLLWVPLAIVAGLGLYFGQGAPSTDAIVIVNGFAQVLVVSIAEILVCWVVVAGVFVRVVPSRRRMNLIVAAVVASVLFGVYHLAHSAPFNTVGMVGLLTLIGLLTSAVFFVSQDAYATIAFHNFLGVFGVVQALAAQDRLAVFAALQWPLIGTAAAALAVLVLADRLIVRRSM